MKTEFRAKFLQHLNRRDTEKGFTLIELLVVIIIIGILSAIALPSFLSQANKAKQTEAKQYISSINKGQQAYYAENSVFSTTKISDLGLGIKEGTTNYTYVIGAAAENATSTATPGATSGLRAYSGGVGLKQAGEAKTTQTILCEADAATSATPPGVDFASDPIKCTGGKEVTK